MLFSSAHPSLTPDSPTPHCLASSKVAWPRPSILPCLISSFHPPLPSRWLLLDTDTHDLVAIHTDGNEQISVVSFSPGRPGVLVRQGRWDQG